MAGQPVLAEWSDEAKLLYLRLRVDGLSQIKAQDAMRTELGVTKIYGQGVLSRFEKRAEAKKITVEYLAERQDKFGELPFAKRYERISANAEMAHALANRFWDENGKKDVNTNSLVKLSSEFRQCLQAIKEDIQGMGVEDMKKASGFEAVFAEGLKALGVDNAKLEAMGITKDDLKVN